MLLSSLKIAIRNLRKNRLYASLNLLGLITAFAAVTLIWLYVQHETGFENFHTQADRIHRVTYAYDNQQGFSVHWARVPVDYVNDMANEFPEIQEFVRFQRFGQHYFKHGDQKFRPDYVYGTDSTVFKVFDFQLIHGDPATALAEPHSVVLSASMATAVFGTTDVLGETLQVIGDFDPEGTPYQVTGVIEDLPANTHLPVDVLYSFGSPEERGGWAYIYLLLHEQADVKTLEARLPDFVARHTDGESSMEVTFHTQPLADIHLHSNLAREMVPNGNALYPRLFRFVAVFILLIALFNYVNLSSALAMGRGKEIGMRQLLGASNRQLLVYALAESVVYNLVAAGIGLGIAFGVLPWFETITGNRLVITVVPIIAGIPAIALVGGMLAGIYPAIVLMRFRPLDILKQRISFQRAGKQRNFSLRKLMLTLQFAAAILLVGSSLVAWSQLRFIQNRNLGLNEEQVLALYANQPSVKDEYQSFRNRVRQIPGVKEVTGCMEVPSREIRDSGPVLVQGVNDDPEQAPMMDVQVISPGFVKMMGLELLAGEVGIDREKYQLPEPFTEDYTPSDYLNNKPRSYLINETAMHQLGWETPEEAIGQQIRWSISTYELAYGPVTGVVRDFHQETLKNKVDPVVMFFEPIWLNTFLVKLEGRDARAVVSDIENVWNELFPQYPMEANFLDDLYDQLYQNERVQLNLLIMFSGLSILIAFLGLFAFIAWALHTRRKELAIRTVLGAQSWSLIRMISRDFWWVLLLGGMIAVPVSYWILGDWLENFAYRVSISPWWYLLTLVLIVTMLLVTIGVQVFTASLTKPVEALREE